ncbi:MAG: Crp/Fnr family transcriptional regulator [Vicinamibacterales bacterium]
MRKTKLVASLFTGPARQVARNTRIFRAGEPAISLFFLASDLVKLTDISTSGDEIVVELHRSGEIFGELCFRGGVQDYSATAIERAEIREIRADLLVRQVRTRPDVLMELLGELSGRLAAAHGELQALLSQTVLVRLGAKLLDLVTESKTGSDWLDLPHDFHHEELAQMLHVRRETVTRAITNLKELGLLATGGRGRVRVHRTEMRRFVRGKRRFR